MSREHANKKLKTGHLLTDEKIRVYDYHFRCCLLDPNIYTIGVRPFSESYLGDKSCQISQKRKRKIELTTHDKNFKKTIIQKLKMMMAGIIWRPQGILNELMWKLLFLKDHVDECPYLD